MKKFMFTFLLTISFCKGADVPDSWTQAVQKSKLDIGQAAVLHLIHSKITVIPNNLNLPLLQVLFLQYNEIAAIPNNLKLPLLQKFYLQYNNISSIDPKNILKQFPKLCHLDLSHNPLTPQDLNELREAAIGRELTIVADDFRSGMSTKSAKR